MMNDNNLNSKEYWDHRFQTDWEAMHGREQSRFFARLALENLPSWFLTLARAHGFTFCDWGCAEGDGTDVLASYFGRDRVCGIDFSEKGVEKARGLYQDLQFLAEDWLMQNGEKPYDVVFSSNTLEHFKRPYDVLRCLLRRAGKCVVLLLPYREFNRHPEHDHTFVAENIPYVPGADFLLVHAQVVDPNVIVPSYWDGHQMLLIYAHSAFLRETGIMLSDVKVHDEQEVVTQKRVLELEDALAQRDEQATCLNQAVAERDGKISNLTQALAECSDLIVMRDAQLAQIRTSLSWRITGPFRVGKTRLILIGKLSKQFTNLMRKSWFVGRHDCW
jgi:hypothetical protein